MVAMLKNSPNHLHPRGLRRSAVGHYDSLQSPRDGGKARAIIVSVLYHLPLNCPLAQILAALGRPRTAKVPLILGQRDAKRAGGQANFGRSKPSSGGPAIAKWPLPAVVKAATSAAIILTVGQRL